MRPGAAQVGAAGSRVRGGGVSPNNLVLYPAYSRGRILWPGQAFSEPALPLNPNTQVTATTATLFNNALTAGSRTITVPTGTALGQVGVNLCGNDIEIIIQAGASIQKLTVRAGKRVRIRGPGKMGGFDAFASSGPITDWIFDGVVFAPDALGLADNLFLLDTAQRIAIMNCVGRSAFGPWCVFYLVSCTDLLMANCNFAVDGQTGQANKWVIRVVAAVPCERWLLVDNVFQSFDQALRFYRDAGGLTQYFQCDRMTMVSTYTPGCTVCSEPPSDSNFCYLRSCTTVMADSGDPDLDALWQFCATASKYPAKNDYLWHVVDHTYIGRVASCVSKQQLLNMMSACQAHGWDVQYLGSAADPTLQNVATITYDAGVVAKWPANASAALWPVISSPLTGTVVGSNPHAL